MQDADEKLFNPATAAAKEANAKVRPTLIAMAAKHGLEGIYGRLALSRCNLHVAVAKEIDRKQKPDDLLHALINLTANDILNFIDNVLPGTNLTVNADAFMANLSFSLKMRLAGAKLDAGGIVTVNYQPPGNG